MLRHAEAQRLQSGIDLQIRSWNLAFWEQTQETSEMLLKLQNDKLQSLRVSTDTLLLKHKHGVWRRVHGKRVSPLNRTSALARHAVTAARVPKPQVLKHMRTFVQRFLDFDRQEGCYCKPCPKHCPKIIREYRV